MLTRIDLEDRGTAATVEASGRAVTDLCARGLVALLEPFLCRRENGRVVNDLSPAAVVKSVAIASGPGPRTSSSWPNRRAVGRWPEVRPPTPRPPLLPGAHPDALP